MPSAPASSTARLLWIGIAAALSGLACDTKEPAQAADRAAPSASVSRSSGAPPSPAAAPPGADPTSLRGEATRAYGAKDFATCARLFLEAASAARPGSGSDVHPRWKTLVSGLEAGAAASRAGQNEELAALFRADQADRTGAPGARADGGGSTRSTRRWPTRSARWGVPPIAEARRTVEAMNGQ